MPTPMSDDPKASVRPWSDPKSARPAAIAHTVPARSGIIPSSTYRIEWKMSRNSTTTPTVERSEMRWMSSRMPFSA